jgi:pimeloyl-ACP methyl ester carboxylesterase
MPIFPIFHYLTAGPAGAPWITFIPGIGNDASFWRHQAAALSARYPVLCFDPWGHGDCPPPPPGCRFDDIVQGVVQLWDALGIARSTVVGLGFGGSVALALAIDHPTRVERVAAFCSARANPTTAATSGVRAAKRPAAAAWRRWSPPPWIAGCARKCAPRTRRSTASCAP